MKYENLEKATIICQRIKELEDTLSRIKQDQSVLVIVSPNSDGAFPIIREWDKNNCTVDEERGLYEAAINKFLLSIIEKIKERIKYLETILAEL